MAQPQALYTAAEYLALERQATAKSEFFDGQIFAMAGASRRHNLITGNVVGELRSAVRHEPCEVYPGDMRVKIAATGLYTYPDAVVVCGEPEFEDAEVDTLMNPVVLVEVLSPSTADYDRGGKFAHYRTLGSVREVLFIAQDSVHVIHCRRQDDNTWILAETRDPADRVVLTSIEAELALEEVYAKVSFEDPPRPRAVS